MLEGLAVWALFIYLLRLVGMPWNKFSQSFAYLGGAGWLLFVWVGLINYTPMDLSGGSLVQAPHIQLRPASTQINGRVETLYVKPNQKVAKGEKVYRLDDEPYKIALDKAKAQLASATTALRLAKENVGIIKTNHQASLQDIKVFENERDAANNELIWKQTTLQRYQAQNDSVADTVSKSLLDEQTTAVNVARSKVTVLSSKVEKADIASAKAQLEIEQALLMVSTRLAEVETARQNVKQAQWNLANTSVYAPDDGYLTNFIMREGQYVGVAPRMQMYTNEKYVLMRVNHQAIRNVKAGQRAEFASPVYPGKIFAAEVEGIIEATGEAQGNLLGRESSVRAMTGQNVRNKHHFVRLALHEPQGYDIPVGAVGLAWISAEKPTTFLNFLDVIRGLIIRMKSQLYFFYSV